MGLQTVFGSAWAVADQALVSLGSFLFSVLLARSISEVDFGIAALAIGGLHVLHGVHRSVLLFPYSLRVSSASAEDLPTLLYSTVVLSFGASLGLAGIAATLAIAFGQAALAPALFALVIVAQTQEVFRWTLLARLEHKRALLGDAIRHLTPALALGVLALQREIHLSTGFAILVATALISTSCQALQLKLKPARWTIRSLASGFWTLGRWDLLGSVVTNISAQMMAWAVGITHGPAETARLQAVANVLGASHPVLFGVGNVITPAVAQSVPAGRDPRHIGMRYGLTGLLFLAPYFAVLMVAPNFVLSFFYGSGSDYAAQHTLLRLFVMVYIALYGLQVAAAILSGLGQSRELSRVMLMGFGLSTIIMLPLAVVSGTAAASAGCVMVYVAQIIVAARLLRRNPRKSELTLAALETSA
jgi:O-antigen/teichoic acid export membrane protein